MSHTNRSKSAPNKTRAWEKSCARAKRTSKRQSRRMAKDAVRNRGVTRGGKPKFYRGNKGVIEPVEDLDP